MNSMAKRLPSVASRCLFRSTTRPNSSKSSKLVHVEMKKNIMMISINRPEVRNCVNHATATQLLAAFEEFNSNRNALVAVLYGKGGCFSAGFDLTAFSDEKAAMTKLKRVGEGPGPMGPSRLLLEKPMIAAVEGYAVAGGLELSLLADMRVADEKAIFGVFCRRFGVPLIDGGTIRLPKLIGLSRALDLILTGRPVLAQEALQFGLVNRVVPEGQAIPAAVELATWLTKFPQECMRKDRLSAYNAMYDAKSMEDALRFEFDHGVNVVHSEAIPGARQFAFQKKGRGGSFE